MTKICRSCAQEKSLEEFYSSSGRTKDGYRNQCKLCYLAGEKQRRLDDPVGYQQRMQSWREDNAEERRLYLSEWYQDNKPRHLSNARSYYRSHQKQYLAYSTARKKHVKQATPPWADLKAIQKIYQDRPDGYHVDHIVPLRGRDVCGLHVPCNLQYLPAKLNLSKHNRIMGDTQVAATT